MNKVFVKFCFLQAAYWSFFASLPGYITAYMLERGMSAGTLGILLAVNMGLSFAGSLFWGSWVDRRQGHKWLFLLGTASAMGYALLVFLARSPVMVIAGTILTNISFGLLFPTMREITEESVWPALRTTAHSVIDVHAFFCVHRALSTV